MKNPIESILDYFFFRVFTMLKTNPTLIFQYGRTLTPPSPFKPGTWIWPIILSATILCYMTTNLYHSTLHPLINMARFRGCQKPFWGKIFYIKLWVVNDFFFLNVCLSSFRPTSSVQQNGLYNDGVQSTITGLHSVPVSSPLNPRFYNQCKLTKFFMINSSFIYCVCHYDSLLLNWY